MKKLLFISAVLISIFGLFFSCKKNPRQFSLKSENTNSTDLMKNSLSIVATTFPCYDAVRAVSGNFLGSKINLKLLVKPGAEVHSYDPSPADIIAIQNSDIFVFVGGESDEWIENVLNSISAAKTEGQILRLMDFVKTLEEIEFGENGIDETAGDFSEGFYENENHGGHDSHDFHDETQNAGKAKGHDFHSSLNPHEIDEHIWTSPENEIAIVQAICENLLKVAESKNRSEPIFSESEFKNFKNEIKKNAESYKNQIQEIADFTNKILSEKQERFILMADRFPFTYFADFYSLDFDAAFSGCSTAVEASTATISRLIDTVKAKNLPAVFYIELGNHKIADTIAESTDTKTILLQSCQNVTKNDFENGETWVSLMKRNAEALKIGLR